MQPLITEHSAPSFYPVVSGQSVLGICYKDGIMMGCDTQLCYGNHKKFRNVPRLFSVCESNVLLGFSGEYSDMQYIMKLIEPLETDSFVQHITSPWNASQISGYLSRVLYNRRCRLSPLWASVLIGGFSDDNKPFLSYIDPHGTVFKDTVMATGLGGYMALPLLREKGNPEMSEDEAKILLEDCLRILSQRDCRAHTTIQLAKVTHNEVTIEDPFTLEQNWNHSKFLQPSIAISLSSSSW